jgi:hypothetical protein
MSRSRESRRSRPITLAALGAAAALLGAPAPTQACSFPDCQSLVTLPQGTTLPANAARFAVGQGALALGDAHGLQIRDDSGAAVAASIKRPPGQRAYFSANEALAPERFYTLLYDGRCHRNDDGVAQGAPMPLSYAFYATPSQPPPTGAGALVEVERGAHSDSGRETGNFVRLVLQPSQDFAPFFNLTSWSARVDGQSFQSESYVQIPDPTVLTIRCFHGLPGGTLDSCGNARTVSSGKHRVELIPATLGLAAQLPPVVAEVTVDCQPAPPPPATAGADGGRDGGGDTTPSAAGCAIGTQGGGPAGRRGSLVAALAALVTGLALSGRGRRRGPGGSPGSDGA